MNKGYGSGRAQTGTRERGIWRLMLKLPAVRGRLQILAAKPSSFGELFEAYDEACATLDRLLKETATGRSPMIDEYRTICEEIESEVIRYCVEHGSNMPE
ncbi:hypothetical protein [Rhizobium sp. GCM10022189]|uniref:hypothetical protein n=1 Tax=Rhizobium sp. GCM10022189 TaxID=3252654 RepID=UPI00360A4CD9